MDGAVLRLPEALPEGAARGTEGDRRDRPALPRFAGQAQVVHDFVEKILDVDRAADVVVIGDLNDYQFSPPLYALETGTSDRIGPRILTDLITTLPRSQQYTYVYDGVSQVLDHILLSPALVAPGVSGTDYQVVHVNAEYADQTSDHDPQVVDIRP